MNTRKSFTPLSLILVCLFALAADAQPPARYETVRFESKLTGKALPYNVVLPHGYHRREARAARYPVVFLLHGYTGHYDNWVTKTKLTDYAAQYEMIIVTPEGNNGWYTDSATVPADKYESYIIRELIPDVERRYRARAAREGRAVAGLSMGGYGALKFGVKYPETFALAASMSGAVNAAYWREDANPPRGPMSQSLLETFGPDGGAVKAQNDLFRLVRELPAERVKSLPFLYLDCGTEDALRLLPSNLAFANLLVERRIPHEYRQLPGDHNWAYWDRQVQEVLRLAAAKLAMPSRASIELPRVTNVTVPAYPALAAAQRIGGVVLVDVEIDADGKVTEANVVSGPALLREAAELAALRWRFERVSGAEASRSVRLTFIFHETSYVAPEKRPDFTNPYQVEVEWVSTP